MKCNDLLCSLGLPKARRIPISLHNMARQRCTSKFYCFASIQMESVRSAAIDWRTTCCTLQVSKRITSTSQSGLKSSPIYVCNGESVDRPKVPLTNQESNPWPLDYLCGCFRLLVRIFLISSSDDSHYKFGCFRWLVGMLPITSSDASDC